MSGKIFLSKLLSFFDFVLSRKIEKIEFLSRKTYLEKEERTKSGPKQSENVVGLFLSGVRLSVIFVVFWLASYFLVVLVLG